MNKMTLSPPKYSVDQVIISDKYMGKITSAFYKDGWNYNIGRNASQLEEVPTSPYPIANIHIAEKDVLYIRFHGHWKSQE